MRRTPRPTLETSDVRAQGLFNIGQASEASGVSAKMIRHYESIGLLPPAERTFSNYRVYSQNAVHTLQFVRRARDLGFSMKQIHELLGLWLHRRPSRDVRKIALEHVKELTTKIEEMAAMKRTLENLAAHCHGDDRPECPILDDLALHERQAKGQRS
ncbi:MAG: Cu(I)-responsive transcriptional regulator [Acidobacteria bacterium]|nr:Cu(I)-responsive transcriptional regulator [Acidobacteriota bacterium]